MEVTPPEAEGIGCGFGYGDYADASGSGCGSGLGYQYGYSSGDGWGEGQQVGSRDGGSSEKRVDGSGHGYGFDLSGGTSGYGSGSSDGSGSGYGSATSEGDDESYGSSSSLGSGNGYGSSSGESYGYGFGSSRGDGSLCGQRLPPGYVLAVADAYPPAVRVSQRLLQQLGVCSEQLELFSPAFPEGALPTGENLRRAHGVGVNLDWLLDKVGLSLWKPPSTSERIVPNQEQSR